MGVLQEGARWPPERGRIAGVEIGRIYNVKETSFFSKHNDESNEDGKRVDEGVQLRGRVPFLISLHIVGKIVFS